ncbi:hypothetical protein FRC17_001828 [Serendipita sp. 399]|nr:hypothetical protein FRC17_001828 [Serendipita sp. 399]
MQDWVAYSPFNKGEPLRTRITQADVDPVDAESALLPTTHTPAPKPLRQRVMKKPAGTRRRRAKQHNDSPATKVRIAQLGEFGQRIMDHYAGDLEHNRLSVLDKFEAYMEQNDNQLPFQCFGPRGPKEGGGVFLCCLCKKEWPNLQKCMADLLGHWHLKPWQCLPCGKSYQGLNEYTRHRNENHRGDRASSEDSLLSVAQSFDATRLSPGLTNSSQHSVTPPPATPPIAPPSISLPALARGGSSSRTRMSTLRTYAPYHPYLPSPPRVHHDDASSTFASSAGPFTVPTVDPRIMRPQPTLETNRQPAFHTNTFQNQYHYRNANEADTNPTHFQPDYSPYSDGQPVTMVSGIPPYNVTNYNYGLSPSAFMGVQTLVSEPSLSASFVDEFGNVYSQSDDGSAVPRDWTEFGDSSHCDTAPVNASPWDHGATIERKRKTCAVVVVVAV